MARDHRMRLSRRYLVQGGLALAGVGLLAGCGLTPSRALWASGPRRVGYLSTGSQASAEPFFSAFRAGLAEFGYGEGQSIALEPRYAGGQADRLPALAAELVALPVDVILTDGPIAVRAARQATTTIPVVFAQGDDPVADGWVASMGRPGGNLTGLTVLAGQQEGRRLQLMAEVAPSMTRVAVLYPSAIADRLRHNEEAGRVLGLQILPLMVDRLEELDAALNSAIASRADGLVVIGAAGLYGPIVPRIVELSVQNRWPTVSATPSVARVGGLLAYGANIPDLYRRAAGYVDKILKGANPGDLPIERPATFELVVNLKTALAIGVTVPESMRAEATEVIQ